MTEEKREKYDGERARLSMWCKRKWVSISPLFDSLFSAGKESSQLAPHNLIRSTRCNTTTVQGETFILILN